jgi:5-methylcytosine-specific restriction enzyme B
LFRSFCETASSTKAVSIDGDTMEFDNPTIWKVSIEGAGDNSTKRECFENGHIRIGWDNLEEKLGYDTPIDESETVRSIILDFQDEMEVGDIVLTLRSQDSIDGIGVVTGKYEYDRSYNHYRRKRNVRWIAKNINENILALNGNKKLTLRSVYRLNRITLNDLMPIINKYREESTDTIAPASQEEKNYVFIIDEINRGNISKIFGELITLIENQKRIGMDEEIKVTLPYSKKEFVRLTLL